MRKTFLIISALLFSIILISCGKDEESNQDKLNEAYDALTLDVEEVLEDIDLPKNGLNDVEIVWSSSNEELISAEGAVTRPSFEDGNQKVTLTATLSLDDLSKDKEFEVTVIALDEEIDPDVSMLVVLTYSDASGAIAITAPAKDSETIVYYAITKEDLDLDAEDIIDSDLEAIVDSGSAEGGLRGTIVKGLDPLEDYYVHVVGVLKDVVGEVKKEKQQTSDRLFWGDENPDELGYYPIYDLRDLEEFNRGYNAGEYDRYSNIKLMNDIDMSEEYGPDKKNWEPLNQPGDDELGVDPAQTEYHGIFDGNGKTINGLYIESSDDFVGFFKKVDLKENYSTWDPEKSAGEIFDLTFTNATVIATFNEDNPQNENGRVFSARGVGVLAGWFRGHRLENISVIGGKVERIGEASDDENSTGGIVGLVQSHGWHGNTRGDTRVIIRNVMSDIEVIGYENVGGLFGQLDDGWSAGSHEMLIENAYSYGNTTGHHKVGGIVGTLRAKIKNAVAYGEVKANKDAGGVIGYFRALRRGSAEFEAGIENVFAMNTKVEGGNYSKVFWATNTSLKTVDNEWFPYEIEISGTYYSDDTEFIGSERAIPSDGDYEFVGISKEDFLTDFNDVLKGWTKIEHDKYGEILIF